MNIVQDIIKSVLSFSSDAVIIAILALVFAAYGIFFGKGKLISIILSFYPAVYIFDSIPYFKKILTSAPITFSEALIQILIFLALFIPINFVLRHFIHGEFSSSRIKKVLEAGILGLTATSLVILFTYHGINLQKIYNFSSGIDSLFLSGNIFWWLLAPFVIIFFFRR